MLTLAGLVQAELQWPRLVDLFDGEPISTSTANNVLGIRAERRTSSEAPMNPDGSMDAGFGTNGVRHFEVATGDPPLTVATAMTLRPDGRAIVVGAVNTNTEGGLDLEMLALQLLDDGSPDASFGTNGVSLVSFDLGAGSAAAASDVAIDAQGRIVLGGAATNLAGNLDFAAARLLPNGDLDNGFGQAGRMMVGFDLGGHLIDRAASLAIDSEGRIYLAGSAQVAPDNDDVGVLRLRANGLIDTGFGNNGKFVFGIDNNPPVFVDDFANAMVLDGRDRPVIVGASYLRGASVVSSVRWPGCFAVKRRCACSP